MASEMIFENFGNQFKNAIGSFAAQTSSSLIDALAVPLSLGITIYFTVTAYRALTGFNAHESIVNAFYNAVRIAFVSWLGLNAGNFISLVIPAIQGVEDLLVGAMSISSEASSAWGAIDELWESFIEAIQLVFGLTEQVSIWKNSILSGLFILTLTVILGIVTVYFTCAAIGVLLLAETSLTIALGLGPFFIALLLFPLTRSWFDGWMRAVMSFIFTNVIAAAVMLLFTTVFDASMTEIQQAAAAPDALDQFASLLLPIVNFTVLAITAASLIRLVPGIAAGLTGGVAMQAFGLGAMLSGISHNAATAFSALRSGSTIVAGGTAVAAGTVLGNQSVKNWGKEQLGIQAGKERTQDTLASVRSGSQSSKESS